MKQDTNKIE